MDSQTYKTIAAGIITLALIVLLAIGLWPFLEAFVAALAFYVLLNPIYKKVTRKWGWNKKVTAIVLILLTILIITIPIFLVIKASYSQVYSLVVEEDLIAQGLQFLDTFFPNLELKNVLSEELSTVGSYLSSLLLNILKDVTNFLIAIIIMYFTLYYLLTEENLGKNIISLLPFNKKNTQKLVEEFQNVTHTTIITTGLLAILQGVLIGVGFYFFGVSRAVLWGVVAAILSFIPMLGTPIVWVPAGIIKATEGNYALAIGIFVWGAIVSSVDNILRPHLQSRIGKMHPLTTLIGIFIGLPMFGLIGIIVGPLLLSYTIILIKIFKEEYLA